MLATLRKFFRPNARQCRVMSGICAAFILATIAISTIFITAEAGHDCDGNDCPICQEMQNCVANFQLLGSSAAAIENPAIPTPISAVVAIPRIHHKRATTLQLLDVRFNE